MMLKAQPTTKEHIDLLDPEDVGFDVSLALETAFKYPDIRPMMTFLNNENAPVFVCGLSQISPGLWEAWLIPSKILKKHALSAVKTLREFTDWVIDNNHAHRLQIAVLEHNVKWAQALGFHFECIVKNYHSNRDHFMYVKVRE
jgi:hypothetical protein